MSQILNIEIKAKVDSHTYAEDYLLQSKAIYHGVDRQIDTYFLIGDQRLKLRQGNIENSLVLYHRKEKKGLKESEVILQKLPPKSAGIKSILEHVIGTKIIVDKIRKIYFIDNVKIHLDKVKSLGYFIEIEAISENGKYSKAYLSDQCEYYIDQLKINRNNLIAQSYSDMLTDL